jgi:serine/threonine protein kinase/Tol biopolymer transport system component
MALTSGTKLGPYEVLSPLGAGGMGEVYRARDTRLERIIAVKVLPESVATDAERLRRFEQEAKAVAALNHPNILSVHDIGEQTGILFIITELLDGQTLREKLRSGPLPLRRATEYALQIARGLAAAHEKGVIHRDLKPANLFVNKDGRVKILDFGLAKRNPWTAQGSGDGATLESPDATPTVPGVALGTAGYMSPEQVRGEAADHRSDIFSFGAVLYEMLCGQRAFKQDTAAETMAAILKEDPPEFSGSETKVSAGVERIMRRCLEKSPEQRFQSAKDLAFALEAVSGTSQATASQPAPANSRPKRWTVAASVGVLAVAVVAYLASTRSPNGPARFERVTFQRGFIKGARFAPDGQNVIYSAAWEGRPYEVFSTHIGGHNARSLELKNAMVVGVSGAGDIAVLTNVRRIRTTSWIHSGTLARAPANGGTAREILEAVWDADISRDGKQFAVVRKPAGPHQLEYPIGKVLFKTNGYISHPRISPNGELVAFLEHPLFGDDRGYVGVARANGGSKRLTIEASAVEGLAWSPDGREIWYAATGSETHSQERTVHAVTLDGKVRKIFGVPGDVTVWDIAADGRLLFTHEIIGSAQLVASPSTAPERNITVLGHGVDGAISSDGKTVAFTESGPGTPDDYLVFFRHLDGSPAVELGEGSILGMTPDGKHVVALVPSQPSKLRILPTGAGEARTFDVTPIQVDHSLVSWMPGAKEFVFLGHEGIAPPRAYRVSLDGGPASPLTNREGAQFWNRVSPDGRFVLQGASVGMDWERDVIVDLGTGKVRAAPLQEGEAPIDWDEDGKHIFVEAEGDEATTILRIDAFTGRREVWKQIRPNDPAGALSLSHFYVTPSGNAYAYNAERVLSALYVYSEK